MRDMAHNILPVPSLAPEARTTSDDGATVDRQGYESATFIVTAGAWTDGTHTFAGEHSDDGSDWDAIDPDSLIGAFPVVQADGASPPAGDGDLSATGVGYIGARRYIRATVTVTGTPSTGLVAGVDVVLGHAHNRPVA